MKQVGLVVNEAKPGVQKVAMAIVNWLEERNIKVCVAQESLALWLHGQLEWSPDVCNSQLDFIVVLGGDGTILQTGRAISSWQVPVLGVNFGQLGFLTEVEASEINEALDEVLKGNYHLDERIMLRAQVFRQGNLVESSLAVNDVVITKGAFARIVRFEAFVDGEFFSSYHADGIIVASPTGSTAYSLSAGGPLVPPQLDLMLMTPICPHSLTSRPLVISGDSEVMVRILSDQGEVMLTLDGQHGYKLQQGDEIIVGKASEKIQFVRLHEHRFFDVVREKLKGGGRN